MSNQDEEESNSSTPLKRVTKQICLPTIDMSIQSENSDEENEPVRQQKFPSTTGTSNCDTRNSPYESNDADDENDNEHSKLCKKQRKMRRKRSDKSTNPHIDSNISDPFKKQRPFQKPPTSLKVKQHIKGEKTNKENSKGSLADDEESLK